VRAIRQKWSKAIFENGLTGVIYKTFGQIPFAEVEELFVYRDAEAAEIWDTEGATTNSLNLMIHLLGEIDLLTIVIDQHDVEMDRIEAAIRSGLANAIVYEHTVREAA